MSGKIVVIDDEVPILEVLQELLEMEGYSVAAFDHPAVALERETDLHADLFVIDIMLPESSGIEVAKHLRDNGFASTPMVATSASPLMVKFASESGVFDHVLEKPFDAVQLLEFVAGQVAVTA